MQASDDLFGRIRRLAIEDPQAARKLFLEAFERNRVELRTFLELLRKPNEWRLRQLVANSVRTHPDKNRIVADLAMWRRTETDEFTRRALEFALKGVEISAIQSRSQLPSALPSGAVEAYSYVSRRLRHRLRNAMLAAQGYASRLSGAAATDPDIQSAAVGLNDAMKSLGRELEATDVDPEHFCYKSVDLASWLKHLNLRYAEQYSPVDLNLIAADDSARVWASDYLLETIFWNIWLNAHQAAPSRCEVTIEFEIAVPDVILLVLDNGDGFSRDLWGIVFQQAYSSKDHGSGGRGHGLLEIQDATERLGGRVELRETGTAGLRIQIRLPLET